jgi:hypothetical protein
MGAMTSMAIKYHTEDECEDARCPVHSKREWTPKVAETHNGERCGVSCTDPLRIHGYCERHYKMVYIDPVEKERVFHRLASERLAGRIARLNDDLKQAKADQGIIPTPVMTYCMHAGCPFKSPNPMATRTHQLYCTIGTKRNSLEREMAANKKAANKPPRAPKAPTVGKVRATGLTEDDLF